jgi:hypothetical protein
MQGIDMSSLHSRGHPRAMSTPRVTRSNSSIPLAPLVQKLKRFKDGVYHEGNQTMYTFGDVVVRLDAADAGDTDTCPIWQERFKDVELEIAKGKPFLKKQPEICVATLQCGHRFSALGIMYHFVLLDMRCPLCRDGVKKRARVSSIPCAFRECMKFKLKSIREDEKMERDSLDAQAVLQMQQRDEREEEWVSAISTMLAEDSRVNMTVYMFATSAEGLPVRSIHFQDFEMLRVRGGMLFSLPPEVRVVHAP